MPLVASVEDVYKIDPPIQGTTRYITRIIENEANDGKYVLDERGRRVRVGGARIYAFSLAGVTFQRIEMKVFSDGKRPPVAVIPTQDLTAEQVRAVKALIACSVARPGNGVIKPSRDHPKDPKEEPAPLDKLADVRHRPVNGDVPLRDIVQFEPLGEDQNERVAQLERELEELRAKYAEQQAAAIEEAKREDEADKRDEEATRGERRVPGPRRKSGEPGVLPG